MNVDNAFEEFETDEPESFPEIEELNIISGGCHLYGYMLTPLRLRRRCLSRWRNACATRVDV